MFRSRVAEALFKKYNKNESIKAESAGIFEGDPLVKWDVIATKKFGVKLIGKPKGMSRRLVKSMDLVIIVANDVPMKLFQDTNKKYMAKIITWKIPDKSSDNYNQVKIIIKKIDKKLKN